MDGNNPHKPKKTKVKYGALTREKPKQGTFNVTMLQDNEQALRDAITNVLENGDLISLSLTSDGGCLVICVMSDGDRVKEYVRTQEELTDVLMALSI